MSKYFEERYEVIEEIAEGGEGKILKAYDHAVERYVAIKEVLELKKKREEALKEARAIARISHPNVISLYDVIEDDGKIYLVMEYVEGVSLRELLNELHALPFQSALGIFLQVASAVEFAHSHGILHLDIKPENIMINPSGTVKLTDFGIAQFMVEAEETDKIMGTTHYIAPEALKGRYSPRSDVFALGVVLYEMLAGENPFYSFEPKESYKKILEHYPTPISRLRKDIPEEFDRVLSKSLEKSYVRRYPNVTTFRIKVERFFEYESREEPVRELFEEEEKPRRHPIRSKSLLRLKERTYNALGAGFLSGFFSFAGSSNYLTATLLFLISILIGFFTPALAVFISFASASFFLFKQDLVFSAISLFLGILSFIIVRDISRTSSRAGLSVLGSLFMLESFTLSLATSRRGVLNLFGAITIFGSSFFTLFFLKHREPQDLLLLRKIDSLGDCLYLAAFPALSAILSFLLARLFRESLKDFSYSFSIFITALIALLLSQVSLIPAWTFERLSVSFIAAVLYGSVSLLRKKLATDL
jgi:serine/threonine protein kinase